MKTYSRFQATCDNILLTLIQAVKRIFPGVPVEHVLGPFDVVPQVKLGLH
jgi:hypothetical protein